MRPKLLALLTVFMFTLLRPLFSNVTEAGQRKAAMPIPQVHDEADADELADCLALGRLYIVFRSDNIGPPNVGIVLTDPQGRRFGFDPLTKTGWSEMPVAQGLIDCDANDAVNDCRGTVEVCGPRSGEYALEVIGQNRSLYSLGIYARSKRVKVGESLQSSVSEAHVRRVATHKGSRDIYLLKYSRSAQSHQNSILAIGSYHPGTLPRKTREKAISH
jgi:hypothetical protein